MQSIPISISTILRIVKKRNINVSYDAEFIGIADFLKRYIGKSLKVLVDKNCAEIVIDK